MKFKTALILGGGGARGFAHIGVIKVLEREGFPIDMIVGTSMGAIIGAGYALELDIKGLEEKALELANEETLREIEAFFSQDKEHEDRAILEKLNEILKNLNILARLKRKWIFEADRIIELLEKVIPGGKKFEDLKIPFACVAADLFSGERVIFREGNLLEAVLASCSIPGVFPPVKRERRFLVDGGIISQLPAREAKMLGADFLLAVDVGRRSFSEEIKDGIDLILQVNQIMSFWLNNYNREEADFLISPDLEEFSWSEFSKCELFIQRGEEKAEELLPLLRKVWRKRRIKNFLFSFRRGAGAG